MSFQPHVTVATIVEQEGQFLLVREWIDGQERLNQPAGHLEAGETLAQAAGRETMEETGWEVEVTGVVGVDLYKAPANQITYVRTTFIARAVQHNAEAPLDTGIIGPIWLSVEQIRSRAAQLRSPMVLKVIEDYLSGRRFPLEVTGGQG
ncbi:NUDIX hydrolase [Gilvimarinus agarilyticus]|uniref:NUDIX hydrolase n=1 Tax=unclassified Gilvimarinus TaxID=2642066 RepID=UPI001C085BEB|nr:MULTISPECIES: NUDIX hydrolase [unclassified Gilvimarinus]MBU2886418.1 NUDIX hydrolase [Gilvimarinus agarilyticus]MDO6571097.1 NUDIX hydrolase [Gilvimarinus sp. 2_MG-2023]MDO6745641.1 NUDIX hydrolase [Gilvimarinus sp. 1_MG-2023]